MNPASRVTNLNTASTHDDAHMHEARRAPHKPTVVRTSYAPHCSHDQHRIERRLCAHVLYSLARRLYSESRGPRPFNCGLASVSVSLSTLVRADSPEAETRMRRQ